jgi:hypothetical protein
MKINGIAERLAAFVGADAERGNAAVGLVDEVKLRPAQTKSAIDRHRLNDSPINPYILKQIGKAAAKPFQDMLTRMERHLPPDMLRNLP